MKYAIHLAIAATFLIIGACGTQILQPYLYSDALVDSGTGTDTITICDGGGFTVRVRPASQPIMEWACKNKKTIFLLNPNTENAKFHNIYDAS